MKKKNEEFILGLDLGITSVGWAIVARNLVDDSYRYVDSGVRIVEYDSFTKSDGKNAKLRDFYINANGGVVFNDFQMGVSVTPNAARRKARGSRTNLFRYKLRRKNLIEILIKNGIIDSKTPLSEVGKNTTHNTLRLRAMSAREKVELEEFARILLNINKGRGYKSNRKIKSDEEGQAIDELAVAKQIYDSGLTVGQYVYEKKKKNRNFTLDFYNSDYIREFEKVWKAQQKYYPEVLTDSLCKTFLSTSSNTSSDFMRAFNTVGEPLMKNGKKLSDSEKKMVTYELRAKSLTQQISLEELAVALEAIKGDMKRSNQYLSNISDRSKQIYIQKQTVGEYLWEELNRDKTKGIKNQIFYRKDYLDEFEQIWNVQKEFYPELLTDELKEEIRDVVIFYQRKLKSQKHSVAICTFENWKREYKDELSGKESIRTIGRKVIPRSSPLFQEFSLWQKLNNFNFINERSGETLFFKELDDEIRYRVFDELNIRGEMTIPNLKKYLFLLLKDKEWKLWQSNFDSEDKVEGNRTNKELFDAYKKIAELEGYDPKRWNRKSKGLQPKACIAELAEIFNNVGIDPRVLEFSSDLSAEDYEKQPSYRLWHLLYSGEEDDKVSAEDRVIYGNDSVAIKKKLCSTFGFKPEHAKILARVRFVQQYGRLSSCAIRKIIPFLKAGNEFSLACQYAGYNHSKSITKEDNEKRELAKRLELIPKGKLNQPLVEKVLNQMINVVNNILETFGELDEIHVELARELKKSAKIRKDISTKIQYATARNRAIKQKLIEEFNIPNPVKKDIERYRLWDELRTVGYQDLYSNTKISKDQLFSGDIEIEHIVPKALTFDDSFSNKTLAFRSDNQQKGNRTSYDYMTQFRNDNLGEYKSRVNNLKSIIGEAKVNKLLITQSEIGKELTNRPLNETQYIARKANEILQSIVRKPIISTSGEITSILRRDWGLMDMMKELNLPKYKAMGRTEMEQRVDASNGKLREVEVISNWTKRNDYRHHAMDAIVVAFTTHNHIQYINNFISRTETERDDSSAIIAIGKLIRERRNDKYCFKAPFPSFRSNIKNALETILISYKNKNKVLTNNVNKTKCGKGGYNKQNTTTPRGQMHNETIYGKSKFISETLIALNEKITVEQVSLIVDEPIRLLVLAHLAKYNNDPAKAFSSKVLKNNPIVYKNENINEVKCFEEKFTIRKDLSSLSAKNIGKVVDEKIREILKERLKEFGDDYKKAFSDLESNPVWLNKEKEISIKRVTLSEKFNSSLALHYKRDHSGEYILNAEGNRIPNDYIKTGNNHHIAIYIDENGGLQERVVSFYEAVARANQGLSPIDKEYNRELGWELLFTIKKNEMFVLSDETFNAHDIDLMAEENRTLVCKHLYRVKMISSKDYSFSYHLDSIDNNIVRIRSLKDLKDFVKVRIDHIGRIVHVGEY